MVVVAVADEDGAVPAVVVAVAAVVVGSGWEWMEEVIGREEEDWMLLALFKGWVWRDGDWRLFKGPIRERDQYYE